MGWWDIARGAQTERRAVRPHWPLSFVLLDGLQNRATFCSRSRPTIRAPPRESPKWSPQPHRRDEHATKCRFPCLPARTSGGLPSCAARVLLGQAFLRGELGMGESQDDPRARVARASRLQLATLLQGLDAGPPVSDPVLDPAHPQPGVDRLRTTFDGFLNGPDGPFRIAVHGVRAVDQAPTLLRQGIVEVSASAGVLRVEFDGRAEALVGLVILFQLVAQETAEVAVRVRIFRVDLDGLAEGGDGLVQLTLAVQGVTETAVGVRGFRVDLDGLAEGRRWRRPTCSGRTGRGRDCSRRGRISDRSRWPCV